MCTLSAYTIMSFDLWKEFGSSQVAAEPTSASASNPTEQATQGSVDDEFGEFEAPEPSDSRSFSLSRPSTGKFNLYADAKNYITNDEISGSTKQGLSQDHHIWSGSEKPYGHKIIVREGKQRGDNTKQARDGASPDKLVTQRSDEVDDWGDFVDNIGVPEELPSNDGNDQSALRSTDPSSDPSLPRALIGSSAPFTHPTPTKLSDVEKAPIRGTRPTNVPTPSILLLPVTSLFQSLSSDLRGITFSLDSCSSVHAPLDQASIENIKTLLALTRASARIIVGRKLRWRRDTLLAQSMKIGPARTGATSGMKLTGLDKVESRREDGAAEEAVRTWKQQSGSLRSAISAASSLAPGTVLLLPEIFEHNRVRLAKLADGAVTASHACFLCGLKRDERVEKVDVKVEDSFGEWWIEHWGHVDCTMFWERKKDSLQQR